MDPDSPPDLLLDPATRQCARDLRAFLEMHAHTGAAARAPSVGARGRFLCLACGQWWIESFPSPTHARAYLDAMGVRR
jgi:hypothetical protein